MADRKIQRGKNELLSLWNELNDPDIALSASPSSTVTQAKREQVKVKNRSDWTAQSQSSTSQTEQGVAELKRERRTPSISWTLKTWQQMLKVLTA